MNLNKTFKTYCLKHRLLSKGSSVLIGVSGGKDSIFLVHLLLQLRHELGLQLVIAHFNHRLRKDSNSDEAFVKKFAEQNNIPFYKGSSRKNLAHLNGSLEEKAREERFKFLTQLSKKLKTDCVALAHTQDDLAETVLMRILRGGGAKGMRAIVPKRQIHDVTFIRPLLEFSSKDIYTYLKKHKLSFRTDSTNKDTKFKRNQIRLDLMPYLQKHYNPNVQNVLTSLSDSLAADYDFLERSAQKTLNRLNRSQKQKEISLNVEQLKKQHLAIQRLSLRLAFEQLTGSTKALGYKHLEEVFDLMDSRPKGSIVNLPKNVCAKKVSNNIKLYISKS